MPALGSSRTRHPRSPDKMVEGSVKDLIPSEYDMREVHDLSMSVLRVLENEDVDIGLAAISLALSLGRLLSPTQPMTEETEMVFIDHLMEHLGLYFYDDGKAVN